VKERKLFSDINAFITGDVDDGLLVVTGRLVQDISFEEAQNEIFGELNRLKNEKVSEYELSKVVNKFESTFTFGLTSPLEKAFNLCYYEMLGDAGWLNSIVGQYRNVTIDDITRVAGSIFTPDNCSTLLYKAAR